MDIHLRIPNNGIKVNYKDENAVFECSVDSGAFWEEHNGHFVDGVVTPGAEFF